MASLGLTAVTIVLAVTAIKVSTWVKRGIVAAFWAGYAVMDLLSLGVLA